MKRKIILIILCLLFILGILYLQVSREPTLNTSITNRNSMGYDANLTVTVNKLILFNENEVEQELIHHIVYNDFENMLLSYDIMGYPEKLVVTVYTNTFTRFLNMPAFCFEYAKESH